jgi:hypothetical protein
MGECERGIEQRCRRTVHADAPESVSKAKGKWLGAKKSVKSQHRERVPVVVAKVPERKPVTDGERSPVNEFENIFKFD